MIERFRFIYPIGEKDSGGFGLYSIYEGSDGSFVDTRKSMKNLSLEKLDLEFPFVLCEPEYVFSPDHNKKYPVILGDWTLNFHIFLQNIHKYSMVFVDEVAYDIYAGRLPVKFVKVPMLYNLYVDVDMIDDISLRIKYKPIDVIFIGNMNSGIYPARNRLLKKILTLPEKYKIVVGFGLHDKYIYLELLSRSKIVFDYSILGAMHQRIFETLRAGSCLFLEDQNIEGWRYLRRFEDAVAYSSEDNLIELIEYYLKNDREREKITLNGHSKVKEFSRSDSYRIIWEEIKREGFPSRENKNILSEVFSFRSYINHILSIPSLIKSNTNYIESWADDILVRSDGYVKASVLNDLSCFYFFASFNFQEKAKEFIEKSIHYMKSALYLEQRSLLYWHNLVFLSNSLDDEEAFRISVSNFFRVLGSLPYQESMKEISGYPEPFCPLIFSVYDSFRVYIESVWSKNFDDTETIRKEIARTLVARIYYLLSDFALRRGDLNKARDFCYQVYNIFPSFIEILYKIGRVELECKNFLASSQAYLKAFESDPFFSHEWDNILKSLEMVGDKEKLSQVYDEMEKMSERLYLFNGFKYNTFKIKSVQDLINEFLSSK
ncbi:MAG: glycosyltransferase [bacterium]|nr:glycosyltransferase [bacterium]